jgi:hypothetical protein
VRQWREENRQRDLENDRRWYADNRGHGPTAGDAATVRAQVVQKWRERLTPDQVLEARTALAGFPSRGWVVLPVETAPVQQTV